MTDEPEFGEMATIPVSFLEELLKLYAAAAYENTGVHDILMGLKKLGAKHAISSSGCQMLFDMARQGLPEQWRDWKPTPEFRSNAFEAMSVAEDRVEQETEAGLENHRKARQSVRE